MPRSVLDQQIRVVLHNLYYSCCSSAITIVTPNVSCLREETTVTREIQFNKLRRNKKERIVPK